MIAVQCLVDSAKDLECEVDRLDPKKSCLVLIFTRNLQPDDAVFLAKEIKELLPWAKIIGTSVSGIIYNGEQYENQTLVVIEQYNNTTVDSYICNIENKNSSAVTDMICDCWKAQTPKLLRMFVGGYYDEAHQLLEGINGKLEGMQIAGGMSGELYESDRIPFVFDDNKWFEQGIVCAGIMGENLSIYSKINTACECIGLEYTITKATGKVIDEIENQPAKDWIQRNLGLVTTTQYSTWEDIADNDPLVRFQIALSGCGHAIRYIRYVEEEQAISQYFSRLEAGTRFRISYTSPAKCIEECRETCLEIRQTPIEQIFCYDCLFRKLYLENCAKWELTPYHENPISGVFLLGEFGYSDGRNQLLNGSSVISGMAEEEQYINVDLSCLDEISSIQSENQGLVDFIMRKQTETQSLDNVKVLSSVVHAERSHRPELYHYIDPNLNLHNTLKYELDSKHHAFDKLCLLKIENADMLMSHLGQVEYYTLLNSVVLKFNQQKGLSQQNEILSIYTASADAFILADDGKITKDEFIEFITAIKEYSLDLQKEIDNTPILIRCIVVCGGDDLLKRAYEQLELHRNSQAQIIIEGAQPLVKKSINEEMEIINIIRFALAQDKVIPYYQGIYNNKIKRIDKYEALMRLESPTGRILTPYFFMDIAKRYRLYLDLNLQMFKSVMRDFNGLDCEVTINLSAHDITSAHFICEMEKELKKFQNPKKLTFEILEDEYVTDMNVLKEFISKVRSYGVKIAVDDFGSGYSNLLEIIKIKPDYIKIDGQIVREIHKSKENEAIVNVVTTLGKQLEIQLVAEFVENEEIQKVLESYVIDYSQGYYFSIPQPFDVIFEELNKSC